MIARLDCAIGLDVGNVLTNDIAEWLNTEFCQRWGLNLGALENFRRQRWEVDAHSLPHGDMDELEKNYLRGLFQAAGVECTPDRMAAAIDMTNEGLTPFTGVIDLLDHLNRSGIPLAIVSNATPWWSRRIVARLNLTRLIPDEAQIWSWRIGESKKASQCLMFKRFHEAVGRHLRPEQLILADDRQENIRNGVCNYGLTGIFVPSAAFTATYLERIFSQLGVL